MDIRALAIYGLVHSLPLFTIGILMQRTLSPADLRLFFFESTVELVLKRGGIRLLVGGRIGSLRLRRSWQ